ncbi:MAG: hypothetical protein AMS21_00155 [Gemmatimonas sp. SG8_38_2]|nr:MAG: hypothetical protein AMS21_00155 [Gemmatimonas sp. SG8_38_2]
MNARTKTLVFLAWGILTVALGLLFIRLPASPDQLIFDYIGWVVSQGGVPYLDAADSNWPGKMFLHACSTALFGNHLWSFRLFDYVVLLPFACLVLNRFASRYLDPFSAIIVVPLYQVMYVTSGSWFAGQRDVVAAPFLILGALCIARRREGGSAKWIAAESAALAFAVLIRPTYLLMAPLLFLWDLLATNAKEGTSDRKSSSVFRDHALVALWMLGLFLSLALLAYPSGALAEWFDIAVRFNLEAYGEDARTLSEVTARIGSYILSSWHWYSVFAVLGFYLAYMAGKRAAATQLILVLIAALVSLYVQRKGFEYHLGPFLPVYALFIAYLASRALQSLYERSTPFPIRAIATLVLLIILGGTAKKTREALGLQLAWYRGTIDTHQMLDRYSSGQTGLTLADAVDLADYVKEETAVGDRVLPLGFTFAVNYLSQRRFPLRFSSVALLYFSTEPYALTEEWNAEVQEIFESNPPEMIILFRDPSTKRYTWIPAFGSARTPASLVKEYVDRAYRLESTRGNAECYRRAR